MDSPEPNNPHHGWTRRDFMKAFAGGVLLASAYPLVQRLARPHLYADTFIGKVAGYKLEIGDVIVRGLRELGVTPMEIKSKRILLKPNLVETSSGAIHINTHP